MNAPAIFHPGWADRSSLQTDLGIRCLFYNLLQQNGQDVAFADLIVVAVGILPVLSTLALDLARHQRTINLDHFLQLLATQTVEVVAVHSYCLHWNLGLWVGGSGHRSLQGCCSMATMVSSDRRAKVKRKADPANSSMT